MAGSIEREGHSLPWTTATRITIRIYDIFRAFSLFVKCKNIQMKSEKALLFFSANRSTI